VLPGRGPLPEIANTPVISSPLPQPSPMPMVSQPEGTINILLLGMDRQGGEGIARTDVLVVASIFPDAPSVSLLSIPRDYYAWIPAWGLDKINTAYLRGAKRGYPGGGPEAAMATIEYNFGIPIHYYALVDFGNFSQIVNAVGGVDIIVECPFHDTYPDPASETGQTDIDLEPGLHHLDGKFALWYVRSRWNTSDFDRHRRQQQVLMAIFQQALSQNLLVRLPELWDAYQESVETDLGLREIIFLASVARRLDSRDVNNYFIRGDYLIKSWTAPNGGYVLVPDLEAMHGFVQNVMRPLSSSRASQRSYRVIVSNGSWASSWSEVAAYRLAIEGFEVVKVEDAEHQPNTHIIDYTTTAKGSPLPTLMRLYRLRSGGVIQEPGQETAADFRVVLGADYNPCHGTQTAYWRATPTPSPTPPPTQ
jgi:LCP family protein required for cell wall assembly